MRIITISRQFGSGGRELGKRLSDLLGWDYYDREIIKTLADRNEMEPEEIRRLLSDHGWQRIQLTYRNSFAQTGFHHADRTRMLRREQEMIREIAETGNDCIIVGRDADVILQEFEPFRIFVCANLAARTARCMAHEEKHSAEERMPEKEIVRNIRRIDKERAHTREILTGKHRTDSSMFDLTVNTTGWEVKDLAEAVAGFAGHWFRVRGRGDR